MTGFIDPDCRDPYKHATCAGGVCSCSCHTQDHRHNAHPPRDGGEAGVDVSPGPGASTPAGQEAPRAAIHREGRTALAMPVSVESREQVAAWVGAGRWASNPLVPVENGQIAAQPGDWVLMTRDGIFSVWSAKQFTDEWKVL